MTSRCCNNRDLRESKKLKNQGNEENNSIVRLEQTVHVVLREMENFHFLNGRIIL